MNRTIELYNQINKVLADWNPINLDKEQAFSEYKGYVSMIVQTSGDNNKLTVCLEDILNKLGLTNNSNNNQQVNDLNCIISQLQSILNAN